MMLNGSIVEINVPMPPLGAMFFMNASMITMYGLSGVMQLVLPVGRVTCCVGEWLVLLRRVCGCA